ncbi:Hypothetical_protein [Hexamita inflata]|uniref:Hypothetical_protein n=1 Tax=Hexamita inflata TaxID=28002 RepID=A0AA86R2B8_9EUKA|nr:Hypothetical protein HINF_LOCUS58054 [Hexamita inflata]
MSYNCVTICIPTVLSIVLQAKTNLLHTIQKQQQSKKIAQVIQYYIKIIHINNIQLLSFQELAGRQYHFGYFMFCAVVSGEINTSPLPCTRKHTLLKTTLVDGMLLQQLNCMQFEPSLSNALFVPVSERLALLSMQSHFTDTIHLISVQISTIFGGKSIDCSFYNILQIRSNFLHFRSNGRFKRVLLNLYL